MSSLEWTAIVPARAGSKGLPNKNIKELNGIPLYKHSVEHALRAGASRVLITTDIAEVLTAHFPSPVIAYERPPTLCSDDTEMAQVVLESLVTFDVRGVFVLLQPTSPLRTTSDVVSAVEQFRSSESELLISVCEADNSVLKWGSVIGREFRPISDASYCFQNRQALPKIFRPNGAIYIADAMTFRVAKGWPTGSMECFVMSTQQSLDIDTLEDFVECQRRFTE